MITTSRSLVALVASLSLLAACAVGPDYVRPEPSVPAQFAETGPWKEAVPQEDIARGDWWTVFNDPVLDGLQADAAKRNPDLRAVAARVLQAQAIAGISTSYLYPEIAAGAVTQRFANNPNFATLVDPAMITANTPIITNAYKAVPLYATYEIDLWGRLRRQSESSAAALGASIANFQTALLTLNGDVAQTYFEVRATDELQRLMVENINLHRNTVALFRALRGGGLANEIALSEVETSLRATEAQLQVLEAQRIKLVNKLAILTGVNPEGFSLPRQPYERSVPAIPAGLPSDLLQRRPDIAAAEREMAAANARIGVAVAAYYPAIELTSSVGFESYDLATLTNPTSNIWGLGIKLFQQIFNAGRISLNVERTRAAYEERVALYQAVLLRAFQEVETSLGRLRTLSDQARFQQLAVASANRTATLVTQRFSQGLISQVEVLVAQRAVLAAQGVSVQIVNDQYMTTIALIKALGGGWQDRGKQLPEGSRSMWAPPLKP